LTALGFAFTPAERFGALVVPSDAGFNGLAQLLNGFEARSVECLAWGEPCTAAVFISGEEASSYVQALEDTVKMLPKPSADGTPVSSDRTPRAGRMVAQAREILVATGHTMHIRELLKSMGKPDDKTSRAALSGSLSAYTRRHEIFTLPAPNTFGLIEFGGNATVETEPPLDFGIDEETG
jgi:hypothetical protein